MAKNSLRIWKKRNVAQHKDGVGYKKIAKTLKLSCSTVAKNIQRFNRTGSTHNRHMLSVISRGCVWEMDVWVLPALLQRLKEWRVSLSVLRPYAVHCIKLVCMAVEMLKKACKQFAEDKQTKDMDYWNHVLWSDETKINLFWFRCQAYVAATRWGVQGQVCLAYNQAWWWECHGLGLHECCRHWGATVHWGNHECQHVLWHTEAEHDPLLSETGTQGSIPTL